MTNLILKNLCYKLYKNKHRMAHNFPSYEELKQFLNDNPDSTINEIKAYYNQNGDEFISFTKPNCKKKQIVWAYNINYQFAKYLQTFMKQEYVEIKKSPIACMIDGWYTGPEEFIPITLSIK